MTDSIPRSHRRDAPGMNFYRERRSIGIVHLPNVSWPRGSPLSSKPNGTRNTSVPVVLIIKITACFLTAWYIYYFLSSLELAQRIDDNCQLGQKSKMTCCVSVELYRFRRRITRHGCLPYQGNRQNGRKDQFDPHGLFWPEIPYSVSKFLTDQRKN